jgi:hypothetical protein
MNHPETEFRSHDFGRLGIRLMRNLKGDLLAGNGIGGEKYASYAAPAEKLAPAVTLPTQTGVIYDLTGAAIQQ